LGYDKINLYQQSLFLSQKTTTKLRQKKKENCLKVQENGQTQSARDYQLPRKREDRQLNQ